MRRPVPRADNHRRAVHDPIAAVRHGVSARAVGLLFVLGVPAPGQRIEILQRFSGDLALGAAAKFERGPCAGRVVGGDGLPSLVGGSVHQ